MDYTGSVTSILEGIRDRRPFDAVDGKTGASFESGALPDGTRVVIKHVRPDDWVMVSRDGRNALAELWDDGVFERVPEAIDHTMLSVEAADDGSYLIVMRDESPHLLVEGRVLTRDENRLVLRAMDRLHRGFEEEADALRGFSLSEMYGVFARPQVERVVDLPTPIPRLILRGWELFVDAAPADVAEPMLALFDDPAPLVAELSSARSTLIHGDLRPHNMGLRDDRLVMLDWERAGAGPPAYEFAWYLVIGASRIDATREEVIADLREITGDRFDPHAWDVACIGALLLLGWNKALDVLENPDPAIVAQERADLDWWIARVRAAFETWSPA